jgi:hypothetical protein
MLMNCRELVRTEVIRAMRRGPLLPKSRIVPHQDRVQALSRFGATGPTDPLIIHLSLSKSAEESSPFEESVFVGTRAAGFMQLSQRPPRCPAIARNGSVGLYDAPGLTTPIRVRFGPSHIENIAFGPYQFIESVNLLSPSETQGVFDGALFYAQPSVNPEVENVYQVSNGKALVIRTRDLQLEYYYGKPGSLIKIKPEKPERTDPQRSSFAIYLKTPDGLFMRYHDASWGWYFKGETPDLVAASVPINEFTGGAPIAWPD